MNLKIAARMVVVLAIGAAMTAAVTALRGDGPGDGAEDAPAQGLNHPGVVAGVIEQRRGVPVSYTHLTLPTNREV